MSDESIRGHQASASISALPSSSLESGHHDPRQRRIYLAVLSFSLISALTGLILVLVWMLHFKSGGLSVSSADGLGNLHPVLMFTFMVSLNMYTVLIYRTHFGQAKERLKWTHAILSGANMVMSLLGVFAMYKSHLMTGRANFYSLHSWIGMATNAIYVSQFVAGFVAFLKPGLAQHRRASLMPLHRFLGSAVLVLAGVAAITGIGELVIFMDRDGAYSKFAPLTFVANFAGISVVLMTLSAIYLLASPQYLRPRQAEEEPLKR